MENKDNLKEMEELRVLINEEEPVESDEQILERALGEFIDESSMYTYDMRKYVNLYFEPFKGVLSEVLLEEYPFFILNDENPSPLLCLLLNDRYKFFNTFDNFLSIYRNIMLDILKGKFTLTKEEIITDIKQVKEEYESYLLNINFIPFQNKIMEHNIGLFIQYMGIRKEKDLEKTEKERGEYMENTILPFGEKYNWIYDWNSVDLCRIKLNSYYESLKDLDEVIQKNGIIEKNGF